MRILIWILICMKSDGDPDPNCNVKGMRIHSTERFDGSKFSKTIKLNNGSAQYWMERFKENELIHCCGYILIKSGSGKAIFLFGSGTSLVSWIFLKIRQWCGSGSALWETPWISISIEDPDPGRKNRQIFARSVKT